MQTEGSSLSGNVAQFTGKETPGDMEWLQRPCTSGNTAKRGVKVMVSLSRNTHVGNYH